MSWIRVTDENGGENQIVEIPVETDGSVSLSTLSGQFGGCVSALKYRANAGSAAGELSSVWRSVRVTDSKLLHPEGDWDPTVDYIVVYSKPSVSSDVKRKVAAGEEHDSLSPSSAVAAKTQRLDSDSSKGMASGGQDDYPVDDSSRRCVDLIVLGISYRSREEDVKKYFEQFGELVFSEIKRDAAGQSRGFGFIRFQHYDSQLSVVNKRHMIDGRNVDVKIPDSKTSFQSLVHEPEYARKIFVARIPDNVTADDLRQYFATYGAIKDVYVPKPARSFAFVTFHDSTIVPTLFGNHNIKGSNVSVGPAEPKAKMPSSAVGDYPSSAYKRAKQDHRERTFAYPHCFSPPHSHPGIHGGGQSYSHHYPLSHLSPASEWAHLLAASAYHHPGHSPKYGASPYSHWTTPATSTATPEEMAAWSSANHV